MMVDVSATETALVHELNELVRRIQQKITEFYNTITPKLNQLPSSLSGTVSSAMTKLDGAVREMWAQIRKVLTALGSPYKLYLVSNAWTERVSGPVSAKIQVAEAGSLEVDNYWEGRAATQYVEALSLQKTALEQLKGHAETISSTLMNVIIGMIAFWTACITAMATAVLGIIGGIGTSGTVVGIPLGLVIVIGACVGCGVAVAAAGAVFFGACLYLASTLDQKFNDSNGFPNRRWPPVTIA